MVLNRIIFLLAQGTDLSTASALTKDVRETGYGTVTIHNYRKNGEMFSGLVTVFPVFDTVSPGEEEEPVLTHFAAVLSNVVTLSSPFNDAIQPLKRKIQTDDKVSDSGISFRAHIRSKTTSRGHKRSCVSSVGDDEDAQSYDTSRSSLTAASTDDYSKFANTSCSSYFNHPFEPIISRTIERADFTVDSSCPLATSTIPPLVLSVPSSSSSPLNRISTVYSGGSLLAASGLTMPYVVDTLMSTSHRSSLSAGSSTEKSIGTGVDEISCTSPEQADMRTTNTIDSGQRVSPSVSPTKSSQSVDIGCQLELQQSAGALDQDQDKAEYPVLAHADEHSAERDIHAFEKAADGSIVDRRKRSQKMKSSCRINPDVSNVVVVEMQRLCLRHDSHICLFPTSLFTLLNLYDFFTKPFHYFFFFRTFYS